MQPNQGESFDHLWSMRPTHRCTYRSGGLTSGGPCCGELLVGSGGGENGAGVKGAGAGVGENVGGGEPPGGKGEILVVGGSGMGCGRRRTVAHRTVSLQVLVRSAARREWRRAVPFQLARP